MFLKSPSIIRQRTLCRQSFSSPSPAPSGCECTGIGTSWMPDGHERAPPTVYSAAARRSRTPQRNLPMGSRTIWEKPSPAKAAQMCARKLAGKSGRLVQPVADLATAPGLREPELQGGILPPPLSNGHGRCCTGPLEGI
eukprot:GHVT01072703.1.p1 GENE.GHVT01072703.1~~GHVT01072703.1.p1  ORF type:complete len:139 (-),score=18.18 GHVT01072703.1:121-537(-)